MQGFMDTNSDFTLDKGPIKVNQEKWPFSGLKFKNLENEISVCVGNWELIENLGFETQVWKP